MLHPSVSCRVTYTVTLLPAKEEDDEEDGEGKDEDEDDDEEEEEEDDEDDDEEAEEKGAEEDDEGKDATGEVSAGRELTAEEHEDRLRALLEEALDDKAAGEAKEAHLDAQADAKTDGSGGGFPDKLAK